MLLIVRVSIMVFVGNDDGKAVEKPSNNLGDSQFLNSSSNISSEKSAKEYEFVS